ncbi:MAG TPA: hypothetical protein VLG50_05185 [Candidatus Saccharimonadales bacterium]|nr:hypothetical protein [Candidatus Saccharimonadales bacterium]
MDTSEIKRTVNDYVIYIKIKDDGKLILNVIHVKSNDEYQGAIYLESLLFDLLHKPLTIVCLKNTLTITIDKIYSFHLNKVNNNNHDTTTSIRTVDDYVIYVKTIDNKLKLNAIHVKSNDEYEGDIYLEDLLYDILHKPLTIACFKTALVITIDNNNNNNVFYLNKVDKKIKLLSENDNSTRVVDDYVIYVKIIDDSKLKLNAIHVKSNDEYECAIYASVCTSSVLFDILHKPLKIVRCLNTLTLTFDALGTFSMKMVNNNKTKLLSENHHEYKKRIDALNVFLENQSNPWRTLYQENHLEFPKTLVAKSYEWDFKIQSILKRFDNLAEPSTCCQCDKNVACCGGSRICMDCKVNVTYDQELYTNHFNRDDVLNYFSMTDKLYLYTNCGIFPMTINFYHQNFDERKNDNVCLCIEKDAITFCSTYGGLKRLFYIKLNQQEMLTFLQKQSGVTLFY